MSSCSELREVKVVDAKLSYYRLEWSWDEGRLQRVQQMEACFSRIVAYFLNNGR